MFPIKAHRLNTFCKHLLLITSLWMPVQPVWAEVAALSQQEIAVARPKKRSARNRQAQRSFLQNCLIIARGVGRGGKTLYEILQEVPDEIKGYIQTLKKDLSHVDYVCTPLPQLAASAYGNGPGHAAHSIVETNEIKELLIPDLLRHLSKRTITAVGAQAMTNMIALHDQRNTLTIQQSIRHLVENDEAFENVQSILQDFAKHQRAFYRYWDPNRAVSVQGKVHLFEKAKELYVVELARWLSNTVPLIGQQIFSPITNRLEKIKNPQFLGTNADIKIVAKFFKVLIVFGLRPVVNDFHSAIVNGTDLDDPLITAWDGIATAFNAYNAFTHSRHFDQLQQAQKDLHEKHGALQKLYLEAATPDAAVRDVMEDPAKRAAICALDISAQERDATWKAEHDRLKFEKERAKFAVQSYGDRVDAKGTLRDLLPQSGESHAIDSEWHLGKIGRMISAVTSIVPASMCYANFRKDGTLIFSLDNPGAVPIAANALYLLRMALMRTANITLMIKDGVQEGMGLVQSMKDFKLHNLFLARSLRSISRMHTYLSGDNYFKQTRMAGYLQDVFAHTKSKSFRSLIELAHAPAFSKEKSKDVHRGHALALHPHMQENSGKFQKALWAIGELDAVYAIAKLMREHRASDQSFCFVDFLPEDSDHAQARIENGTLLMVPNSKPNSMALGFDDANKAILSGPNGAGKSVCIKMFGCNVVLAHAFGIAAAERMELHWLTKLYTSIDTSESVADEMSRFQAQKARMDSVLNAIEYNNRQYPQARFMFLTDEPLSGTTPNLAAMYMNEMCEKMRQLSQLVSVMATHSEAPTKFEGNGFVNYQVCVETYRNGLCRPSFKVALGIPEWWFSSDEHAQQQQKSFADYTTTLKLKDKLEKELERLRGAAAEIDDVIQHKRYPDGVSVREARTYFRAQKEKVARDILQVRDELSSTCDALDRIESDA